MADHPALLDGALYLSEIKMPDGSVWVSVVALKKNCGVEGCKVCGKMTPTAQRVLLDLHDTDGR